MSIDEHEALSGIKQWIVTPDELTTSNTTSVFRKTLIPAYPRDLNGGSDITEKQDSMFVIVIVSSSFQIICFMFS